MRGVRSFTAMWASGSSRQISRNYCGRPQATKPVGADPDLSSSRPAARGDLTPGSLHGIDRLSLPSGKAVTVAGHCFDRRGEGTELLRNDRTTASTLFEPVKGVFQ